MSAVYCVSLANLPLAGSVGVHITDPVYSVVSVTIVGAVASVTGCASPRISVTFTLPGLVVGNTTVTVLESAELTPCTPATVNEFAGTPVKV